MEPDGTDQTGRLFSSTTRRGVQVPMFLFLVVGPRRGFPPPPLFKKKTPVSPYVAQNRRYWPTGAGSTPWLGWMEVVDPAPDPVEATSDLGNNASALTVKGTKWFCQMASSGLKWLDPTGTGSW